MSRQITKDTTYNAVAPDDFVSMMDVDRYNDRSDAFDKIIAATHDHFWDPQDTKYIDFDAPFEMESTPIIPPAMVMELQTELADGMDEATRIRFCNAVARNFISNILHGEQAALSLSASLCHILRDPGAQEYAANQAREEARHVAAFSRYVANRWGTPAPVSPALGALLEELVAAPEVYKKIVGMQMLVEGLAMGAFATLYTKSADPVLVRLVQLVMTDEAFHHKFGKIWADRTIPKLSEEEHNTVEDWAKNCFETLLFNLFGPDQKAAIYPKFGLELDHVKSVMAASFTNEDRRERMKESTNIMRVLCKTLLNAGIITGRTRSFYAQFVDMDELSAEGDHMVGDDIAESGIDFLRMVNAGPAPGAAAQ
ncbi:MAG: ferritin-like domain-containing protein [Alphaproteobacteria bacterium]